MQKTILTAACAALIGLGSIGVASAQTTTNEGMTNTTSMSKPTDTRMNSMNKMKKKKKMMMKKGDGMSGGMDKGGMDKGGMMDKKM